MNTIPTATAATVTVQGGHIEQDSDPANYAAVDTAVVTQTSATTGTWVVTLQNVPTKRNFVVGDALTDNTKGTTNPNADNALVVSSVNGPTKYTCTGNWPVNI